MPPADVDRELVCKFTNLCVFENDSGTCANGSFCPFVHKKAQRNGKAAATQNCVRSQPPPTPSTTCSLSPHMLNRKPDRRQDERPPSSSPPPPPAESQGTSESQTPAKNEGGLVRMRAIFTADYTAPAEGYLSTTTVEVAEIMYEEGEWYFGCT